MRSLALASGLFAASVLACTAEPSIVTDDAGFAPGTTGDGGDDDDDNNPPADEGTSDDGMVPDEPYCGNNIIDGEDVCDGTALGETSCQSLGFERGQIGCTPNCGGYDLTDCGFYECGNGDQEGDEDCDGTVGKATCVSEGFDNGTLFCTMECEYNFERCGICGDREVADEEDCDTEAEFEEDCQDLGFMTGDLQCGDDCLWDTSGCSTCGNGVPEAEEQCDGEDVLGKSCESEGFDSGTLGCSDSCELDVSGCVLQPVPFGNDAFYEGLAGSTGMLPCDEISATGTNLGLGDDDEAVVSLPFSFTFYGVDYPEVTVGSNGTLTFGDPSEPGLSNSCLPDAFDLNNIAVFWDDLDPPDGIGGGVRHQSFGAAPDQRFVVQWDAPNFSGDLSDLIRVQAMLHENGTIELCYVDTINAGNSNDNGAESTAGIQGDATTAVEYSCNQPNLVNGLWLIFQPL